jgi:hypothetical protein
MNKDADSIEPPEDVIYGFSVLDHPYDVVTMQSDGESWHVISEDKRPIEETRE